ncbi:MAG: hypothetical protein IT581_18055 [Verrucomicrobiales bacterium]|nr:hypothetical protein [Verrucomicrobiales bacterium]
MNTRCMRGWVWVMGFVGAAALAQSVIDPNTAGAKPDVAALRTRVASFVDEVSLGKMAEEGQGQVGHALDYYTNVIRDFDAIRRPAAEAVFHYAGLMIGSNTPRVGVDAFRRILREFADFEDLASSSRARLRDHGVDEPDKLASGGGGADVGGAVPNTVGSAAASTGRYGPGAGMSPELMRRYGLSPESLGGGFAAPVAGSATSGSGNRYGGSVSARPSVEGVARSRNPAAEMMEDMAASMRAELIQLASQLRKVQREQRVAEIDNLEQLPVNLIEDATMNRILADLQKAREDAALNSKELDKGQRERRAAVQEELATSYWKETFRPRLAITEKLLKEEIDRLQMEIAKMEIEIKQLRNPEKVR